MIPSSGGNLPPDPHPIANIQNPQAPPLTSSSSLSRHTVQFGTQSQTAEAKSSNLATKSAKLVAPATNSFKKTTKSDRNRSPMTSLSIKEVIASVGTVATMNSNRNTEKSSEMVSSLVDSGPVSGNSQPFLTNSSNSYPNIAMEVDPLSQIRESENPLSPSCAAAVLKIGDLECDENLNDENMGLIEGEETDYSDMEEPFLPDQSLLIAETKINQLESQSATCDQLQNQPKPAQKPPLSTSQKQPETETKATSTPPVSPTPNAWQSANHTYLSIADRIKKSQASNRVKIAYYPPMVTAEGKRRVVITTDDLVKAAKAYPLHLYGYFLGTSMDYNRVNYCLKRDWRQFGISEITKSPAGYYYFKFSSEQGMKGVLEGGPWFVNNIPLFVKKWEPDMCLGKAEPSVVPIWVTAHDIPLGLWTDSGICKIMSFAGKPLLMDKVTDLRCSEFTGRIGYARMLVDVLASSKLPSEAEVEFPPMENQPLKVATVKLSYHWKPPVCTHCCVFGHNDKMCKKIPQMISEASTPPSSGPNADPVSTVIIQENISDGFTVVEHKKKSKKRSSTGKLVAAEFVQPKVGEKAQISQYQKGSNSSSSDPNVQQKMSQLYDAFVQQTAHINTTTQPKQTNKPGTTQQPPPPTYAYSRKTRQPPPTAVNKPNSQPPPPAVNKPNSQPPPAVNKPNSQPPPTAVNKPNSHPVAYNTRSNRTHTPKQPNQVKMDIVNRFSALTDAPTEVVSMGMDMVDQTVEEDDIARNTAVEMEGNGDDTECDYGITDLQKLLITESLLKYRKVAAAQQENWDTGEWTYFWDKCRMLKIDVEYAVEDIGLDPSGNAKLFHLSDGQNLQGTLEAQVRPSTNSY